MKEQKETNKTNKLTDWLKEPTYQDFKNDLENSSSFHEDYKKRLLQYEQDRDGGPTINAKPGKSTARPRVVRKNAEWKYPKLEDPFLNTEDMFEVKPTTWEDTKSAEQNELLLNYQWSTKINKIKLINDIVRYAVDDGTVVVKTGWSVEEKIVKEIREEPVYADPEESLILMEQAVRMGQMTQEEFVVKMQNGEPMQIGVKEVEVEVPKIVKNQPKYEVCNTANIIIDPTCEGYIEEANFIIHEYDTSIAELKKEEYFKDEENGEVSGVYHNLELIKDEDGKAIYDEHKSEAYNDFKFTDKARKKLTAYEYWGYWDINGDDTLVPIVATWVGEILIRLEENPFPHKRLPFSIATYMPVKKEVMGEPDAELLRENQESIGKLTRAAHDITSEQAVGQEFIDETLFPNMAVRQQYEKGNTVYYRAGLNPKNVIYKNTVAPVPSSVFNMIQWQQSDAESLTGTKAFAGGIAGNALGDSVGGIRSALDATSQRELSILRRLSELFKDMARLTIAMNQAYLSEEEVVRVTNEEFVTIRRDDLAGEFDLKIDVSTPEKDEDTANKLNTLLQTNAASMDPAEARIYRARIAKLWKQPDMAKDIENFKPQPNPIQEEMQLIALEEAKLRLILARKELEEMDSRIIERVSRTEENAHDRVTKEAQAKERLARAEEALANAGLIREQTDALANEFVKDVTGQKRAEHELDKEFDAAVKVATKASSKVADAKIPKTGE
jgi:hypothetical protein